MVNFAYYSLAIGMAQAAPWNFDQTSDLARGTASMQMIKRDPNFEPIPKRRPTVFSQMNQNSGECSMNPWIFLALLDSNYSEVEKFSLFSSRDETTGELVGENGKYNDAVWASLVNCRSNTGIQKLMAIDALASHKPEVIEAIYGQPTTDNEGFQHTRMNQKLFDSNLEFYKQYWKYNNYIKIFHNTGFNRYYKINKLFQIIGTEESPSQRYRDRKMLFANLNDSDAKYKSQQTQSPFMPRWGSQESAQASSNGWNNNGFMGYRQRPYNYRYSQNQYQTQNQYQQQQPVAQPQPINSGTWGYQTSNYVAPAAPSVVGYPVESQSTVDQINSVVETIIEEVSEIEAQIEALNEVEEAPLPELTEKAEDMIEVVEEEIEELEGQIEALEEVEVILEEELEAAPESAWEVAPWKLPYNLKKSQQKN